MADHTADDDRWEALARYLAGECPPEEAARIQRLLAEEPERAKAMNALAAMMGRLELPPAADVDVDAAWQRTRARMHEAQPAPALPVAAPAPAGTPEVQAATEPPRSPSLQPGGRTVGPASGQAADLTSRRAARSPSRRPFWIAAGLAAALGAVALWNRLSPGTPAPTTYTVSTAVGGRDSLTFADGSRILVGAASRLVVRGVAGQRPDSVSLDGQAYFDIPHDASRPFRVIAGDASITDLGTRFTVRHLAGRRTMVEVHEGSVGFGVPGGAPLELMAGGRALRLGVGSPAPVPGQADSLAPAWTEGRLVFVEASLAEVGEELRRWYGVELTATDSALRDRRVTASFAGESRVDVVRILALAVGATASWQGDTARLEPGSRGPR